MFFWAWEQREQSHPPKNVVSFFSPAGTRYRLLGQSLLLKLWVQTQIYLSYESPSLTRELLQDLVQVGDFPRADHCQTTIHGWLTFCNLQQDTDVGRGQVCRGAAVSIVRQDGWKNWSCLAAGMSAGRVCFYDVFIETGSTHMVIYMHTHLIHTWQLIPCFAVRFTNNLTVV